MLVFGDRSRRVGPRRALDAITGLLAGRSRDQLTRALIEAGELAQGLADLEFQAAGCDDPSDLQAQSMRLATAIAGSLLNEARCDAGFAAAAALAARALPDWVSCKTPEGYAFYAVYPEAYAAAAAAHRWQGRPLVIGVRSIGASLAAVVAAATGGQALTLRPTGPPFCREVRISDGLRASLTAHPGPFAVVDEGPGLSGSSFGCVADLLEELGVAADRIVFMPSHAGDLGPHASSRHRARWARARRLVRTLDDLAACDRLPAWFEADVGPAKVAHDLSAGGWRRRWPADACPPVLPAFERRKVRFRTAAGDYVARFAGLGGAGEAKLERARVLHAAGFAPEPIALRRGFLLERWVEGRPCAFGRDRSGFVRRLGAYLALRRGQFAARAEEGADMATLRGMAVLNAGELCGPVTADGVEHLTRTLERADLRPVHVDARLHPWEWREGPLGAVKLDGLDHSCGHDLIGAQDIAWDVAGASVEFGLSADEARGLATWASADPEHVRPLAACYAAFQAGLWSLAGAAGEPEIRRRDVYRAALNRLAASR